MLRQPGGSGRHDRSARAFLFRGNLQIVSLHMAGPKDERKEPSRSKAAIQYIPGFGRVKAYARCLHATPGFALRSLGTVDDADVAARPARLNFRLACDAVRLAAAFSPFVPLHTLSSSLKPEYSRLRFALGPVEHPLLCPPRNNTRPPTLCLEPWRRSPAH